MRRGPIWLSLILLIGVISCSDTITAPTKAITVTGVIRGRDGAPMPDAFLTFRESSVTRPPFPVPSYLRSDANGEFRVSLVPGVYDINIEPAYNSGYTGVTLQKTEFGPTKTRLDYTFTGIMISGVVTGPTGALLTGASVNATSVGYAYYAWAQTTNGQYRMFVPQDGYTLVAQYGYNVGIPTRTIPLQLSAADTTIDFALTGNEVRVSVSLEGGAPLQGANIAAHSSVTGIDASNRTGIDGTATLYLPDGDYLYSASPPDLSIVSPVVGHWLISGAGSASITFPGTRWDMTLRRASDNAPLGFANVSANEVGAERYAQTSTDASGHFQFFVRANTGYTFSVYLSGTNVQLFVPYLSSTADSTFDVVVDPP